MQHIFVRFVVVSVVSLMSLVGCYNINDGTSGDGVKCNTVEEFVEHWSDAYDQGNISALKRTLLLEGIPEKCIRDALPILTTYAGKHKVTDHEIEQFTGEGKPYECDGEMILSAIEPKWIITIDTRGNEGFEGAESIFRTRFVVGQTNDGRFGILPGDYGIKPVTGSELGSKLNE